MDLYDASVFLISILNKTKVIYLHVSPEVPDFTNHEEVKIIIEGGSQRLILELNRENAHEIFGFLQASVFDKDSVTTLIAWNLKSLFSYFKFYLPKADSPGCSIIDLHVIENFLGIKKKPPENFIEAINRSRIVASTPSWKTIYKSLHLPLMLKILPAMETTPLLDETDRVPKYAYYEIEGQINGRLRNLKIFDKSYLPHTMGQEQKAILRPRGYDHCFMVSDIHNCEISVIQWLTKDEVLGELIRSNSDLYQQVYEKITGDQCNSDRKREMAKGMFIALLYGAGKDALTRILNVSESVAKELIKRTYAQFPVAMNWMADRQKEAEEKQTIQDYFGRPRTFTEKFWQARNFMVQGVAATICLEKLIELYRVFEDTEAKLCFNVHDGYGVLCPKKSTKEMFHITQTTLTAESKLCPGLKLTAETKFGLNLNDMRVVYKL